MVKMVCAFFMLCILYHNLKKHFNRKTKFFKYLTFKKKTAPCSTWDMPNLKIYLLFTWNLNLTEYPIFYLATLNEGLPLHHGLPRTFPRFRDHPFKSKNQCLWSDKNECRKQMQEIRWVPALIIDSALDRDHGLTPSALAHSISEEAEMRNLGWVSHLLFNHHNPQTQ